MMFKWFENLEPSMQVALVGGCFTIIGAVIAGVFSLFNRNKGKEAKNNTVIKQAGNKGTQIGVQNNFSNTTIKSDDTIVDDGVPYIVKRIDEIHQKMEDKPLSYVLSLLLPISLECEDYEGYCLLSLWDKPLCKERESNEVLFNAVEKTLQNEGLHIEQIKEMTSKSVIDYLKMRSIGENKLIALCAKELEDEIKRLADAILISTTPDGLHPTDKYFRSMSEQNLKLKYIEQKQMYEQQYAMLQSLITTKLTEYRRKALLKKKENL